MEHQAFRKGGEVVGMEIFGAVMYTCVVWVVNCQMALSINYFTLIQHVFIWGSIVFWYIFLLVYGAMDPNISTTAYQVFIEACAPALSFWLVTLFVTVATLLPYFSYAAIQMRFFPMYHQMIQWIRNDGHSEDPEYCQMVRQRSLRSTTVGYTARFSRSKLELPEQIWHIFAKDQFLLNVYIYCRNWAFTISARKESIPWLMRYQGNWCSNFFKGDLLVRRLNVQSSRTLILMFWLLGGHILSLSIAVSVTPRSIFSLSKSTNERGVTSFSIQLSLQ